MGRLRKLPRQPEMKCTFVHTNIYDNFIDFDSPSMWLLRCTLERLRIPGNCRCWKMCIRKELSWAWRRECWWFVGRSKGTQQRLLWQKGMDVAESTKEPEDFQRTPGKKISIIRSVHFILLTTKILRSRQIQEQQVRLVAMLHWGMIRILCCRTRHGTQRHMVCRWKCAHFSNGSECSRNRICLRPRVPRWSKEVDHQHWKRKSRWIRDRRSCTWPMQGHWRRWWVEFLARSTALERRKCWCRLDSGEVRYRLEISHPKCKDCLRRSSIQRPNLPSRDRECKYF